MRYHFVTKIRAQNRNRRCCVDSVTTVLPPLSGVTRVRTSCQTPVGGADVVPKDLMKRVREPGRPPWINVELHTDPDWDHVQ